MVFCLLGTGAFLFVSGYTAFRDGMQALEAPDERMFKSTIFCERVFKDLSSQVFKIG